MTKSFHWRVVPGLAAVTVHTREAPSDEDWDAYLQEILTHAPTLRGVLVYSEAAGPSAPQRARTSEAYKKANVQISTAIMSGSRLVRGAVTAMSWTLPDKIKAFQTTEFGPAVEFLGFDSEEQIHIRVVLKQLARSANVEIAAFADESGRFRKKYT